MNIYAKGPCHCSVCVPQGMTQEDIVTEVNRINPTGIQSQWAISKEPFKTGETNPCVCDTDSTKLHYLMEC